MEIRDQCLRAKVPFFLKQWGGVQKKRAGRTPCPELVEGSKVASSEDEMPVNTVRA